MQPLRTILTALAERPDVSGAIVVSDEGLIVESVLANGHDPEAIAALAATAIRGLANLGGAVGSGPAHQVAVDGANGAFILQRLPSGATLLVLAAPAGDLGALLYDIRRHAPALVSLV